MRPSVPLLPYLPTLLALCGGLGAQTAAWTAFGNGCPGGERVSLANNPYGGGLVNVAYGEVRQVALQVDAPTALTITGFDVFTQAQAKGSTTAYVYSATTAGGPGGVLAFGTMAYDVHRGWQGLRLSKPLSLASGQRVFLSWQVQNPAKPPFALPVIIRGTPAPAWFLDASGKWNAGTWQPQPWAWRLVSAKAVPTFGIKGLPRIAQAHALELAGVSAGALVMCLTGASNQAYGPIPLPFDLAPLGASGCRLWCSIELAAPMNADLLGNASLTVPLPGDTSLLGLSYYQQWLVADPATNAFGLSFSNAGAATIGT